MAHPPSHSPVLAKPLQSRPLRKLLKPRQPKPLPPQQPLPLKPPLKKPLKPEAAPHVRG